MQVIEKRRVLRVDLICIHGHDGDVVVFLRSSTAWRHSFTVRERPARARAQSALSVELEYALRIAGEERDFCRLPEIESVETGDAFARWPERVVRSEQDTVPCIAAHVIDKL